MRSWPSPLVPLLLAAALTPACAPPDVTGCWERCGDAACSTVEGVYLEISATTVRETAADGSTCTYLYVADRRDLELSPTGCTLDETGLPEAVYWSEIDIAKDSGHLTYTQTRVFSDDAGLDDQVNRYRFQPVSCAEVPEAARSAR